MRTVEKGCGCSTKRNTHILKWRNFCIWQFKPRIWLKIKLKDLKIPQLNAMDLDNFKWKKIHRRVWQFRVSSLWESFRLAPRSSYPPRHLNLISHWKCRITYIYLYLYTYTSEWKWTVRSFWRNRCNWACDGAGAAFQTCLHAVCMILVRFPDCHVGRGTWLV